jgi:hypothetical protein
MVMTDHYDGARRDSQRISALRLFDRITGPKSACAHLALVPTVGEPQISPKPVSGRVPVCLLILQTSGTPQPTAMGDRR